jgi:hypothetical protein
MHDMTTMYHNTALSSVMEGNHKLVLSISWTMQSRERLPTNHRVSSDAVMSNLENVTIPVELTSAYEDEGTLLEISHNMSTTVEKSGRLSWS